MQNTEQQTYWTQRYQEEKTGWDIGYPSIPLQTYIDQLEGKNCAILIPGAGNAYEAEYLWNKGFENVTVLDISKIPLQAFRDRNPGFPEKQLIEGDFFKHQGTYDLILEQTFFCSFIPTSENRSRYAKQMHALLKPKGKLVGLWFDIPLKGDMEKRPFGGDRTLYLSYLSPHFEVHRFEKCYNSITPRTNQELFGIFIKSE